MEDNKRRILELRQQLDGLGYHGHQLDDIMEEIVGTKNIEKLTQEQAAQVIPELEEYVKFALRCRHMKI